MARRGAPAGARRRGRGLPRGAALLLAGALALAACSPQRGIEAVRVLRDIEAGDKPSALKARTETPARTPVRYGEAGAERLADLYTPTGEAAVAGMVFAPGLTPKGRDDPRVVQFATTMARAGFEVIVPDLPGMRSLQVSVEDAAPIADAARFLTVRDPQRPLGMAAVSFAVGPAVLSLLPSPGDDPAAIDFLLAIGGYYDLPALITYVTTGFWRERADGPWLYRRPKDYGRWVFLLTNAGRIEDLDDRELLLEIAQRKLDDPAADVIDLVLRLGPQGESVYALLTNGEPDRVPALLAALPDNLRRGIDELDLRRRELRGVASHFVLVHDRNDRIIPPAHSEALAAALPEGQSDVFVVDGLDHAQMQQPGIADALAIVSAVYTVLAWRDGSGS